MTTLFRFISFVGLGLTVVPSALVATGTLSWSQHATLMVVGMVVWFATAPVWILRNRDGV